MVAEGRHDRQVALLGEHLASVRRLWVDTPNPLQAARLGPDIAPDFWFGTGLPGIATVRPTDVGKFDFASAKAEVVIIPVYDCIPGTLDANLERHVEHLVDLVAVDIDHPDRFQRRRGHAPVLGSAYLEIAGDEGAPVPVFRNPLTWLQSGGNGVVVLEWDYARDLLLDHELVAEDLDLGAALEDALKADIWIMEAAA